MMGSSAFDWVSLSSRIPTPPTSCMIFVKQRWGIAVASCRSNTAKKEREEERERDQEKFKALAKSKLEGIGLQL